MNNDLVGQSILAEEYLLNRLVYVNSANHAYSELMLNTHMAMFGNNNVGKTASLAGMKLLLFPEVDFYHCESKFKFKGKEGVYSMEESFDFYFPDARSFIILEVNNPEGGFCMILYKTNNYGYGRFFIPVPYEQMRALFWDTEASKFTDNISVAELSKFTKKHAGQQLSDAKEITSLMFSSYRDVPARKRFCVLPLKDDRPSSIDAFRNIYQLAFEAGSLKSNTLPNAIAALLEMGRSRDQERLDANLTVLTEQHSQLYQQGEWLQKIANTKPDYDAVQTRYKLATEAMTDYSILYHSTHMALNLAKRSHRPNQQKISQDYRSKLADLNTIKKELSTCTKGANESKGAVEHINKQLEKKQGSLVKAQLLKARYAGMDRAEILEILRDELSAEEYKLTALKEQGSVAELLKTNLDEQRQLKEGIKRLKGLVADNKSLIFNQLAKPELASILVAINPLFSEASATLSDANKSAILDFTDLFQQNNAGYLRFLGEAFGKTKVTPFNLQKKQIEWEQTIIKREKRLEYVDSEIDVHRKVTSKKNIDDLIKTAEKNIEQNKTEIQSIESLSTLEGDISELKEEVLAEEKELKINANKMDELGTQRETLRGEEEKLSRQLTRLKAQEDEFSVIESHLNLARQLVVPVSVDVEPINNESLNVDCAIKAQQKSNEYNKLLNDFKNKFDALARDLPHPDIDTHKEFLKLADYDQAIRIYGSAFETLDYNLGKQKHAVQSHNQLFNNQISEIKGSATLLNNFVADINKELNGKGVSNLLEINLHLTLNPAFLSLMSVLEKHDIQGDALLEPQLYESLNKFVEKFFNKKSRRLKMADIIAEINYHYQLESTGDVVTKSQSGGTTSVITAFVLAVLLKRITPPYVQLQMPIIVDEISTLDSINTDSTIEQISEHGFSIFCATPSFSASVSQKVGRWVMIDRSMIRQPMVQSCHLNILPEHVESYGDAEG